MFVLSSNIETAVTQQQTRFRDVIYAMWPQLNNIFTPARLERVDRIFLTGCGDSFFAATGARLFYEQVTGLPTEPIEAMEFSRYVVRHISPDALVLGVSNSGKVGRTIEAIIQARLMGVYAVALTGYADHVMALEADAAVVAALPNIRSALDTMGSKIEGYDQDDMFDRLSEPGMVAHYAEKIGLGDGLDFVLFLLGAYLGSLMLLYGTAIQIGLSRHHISDKEAKYYYSEILRSVEIIVRTTYANIERTEVLAQRLARKDSFLFIGAGPAYAAALLSTAKLFEQPHLNGVAQYLEEWAHSQLFFTRPDGIPIFVIAPPGASRDRALEQVRGIRQLGGTVIVVCDSDDGEMIQSAGDVLPILGSQAEAFVPWTYGVPGQLLAITLLGLRGIPPIPAPYSFKQMMQVNFEQIYNSTIKRD